MRRYEKYKPTGIEWVTEIPAHWEVKKLKHSALVQPSNVDKKSVDGEQEVLLCNYVDVYKNEFIDDSIAFMKATASEDQIEKFSLKKGDVLITKDSETPNDIAVPALVVHEQPNLICGYHLAQIRATNGLVGPFLFRLFQSKEFNTNFEKSANGITRYGLGVDTIKDVSIILPPVKEQNFIAEFLDKKALYIDKLISNKLSLIQLLKEERTSLIDEIVTKGTNKKIKLKSSGVEWVGDIPEHWEMRKLSRSFSIISSGTTPNTGNEEYYKDGTIPWINTGDLNDGYLTNNSKFITSLAIKEHSTLKMYPKETLLIAMYGATVGKVGILTFDACTNQACCAISNSPFFKIEFCYYWFVANRCNIIDLSYGGGQPNISQEIIRFLKIPCPPINEQLDIIKFIKDETNKIDFTISRIEKEIELMNEYRASLISQVVTGQVKVLC